MKAEALKVRLMREITHFSDKPMQAEVVSQTLANAGYRILAPGELDAETLEAAAKVADIRAAMIQSVRPQAALALMDALPAAIRALKGESE